MRKKQEITMEVELEICDSSNTRFGLRRLPPPFTHILDEEHFWKYRYDYQKFRKGNPEGAKGEFSEIARDEEVDITKENARRLPSTIFNVKKMDDWEDTSSLRLQKLLQGISKYRAAYRAVRKKEPMVTHRELSFFSDKLTDEQLSLFPVSQFLQLKNRMYELKIAGEEKKKLGFKKSGLHVHFGAGKLGIGLICVALVRSNLPFILVDNSLNMWKEVIEGESKNLNVIVNDVNLTILKIIRPDEKLPENITENLFVCTMNDEVMKDLVMRANSMSTSVGPGIHNVGDFILERKLCEDQSIRPTLYGCENDHKAVEILGEDLKGYVDVVPVLVDRICADRKLYPDKVCVTTEPDIGSIIVITPVIQPAYSPSFGGENVIIPSTATEAHYFSSRKINMVNGMHTTLAFMTLCIKSESNTPDSYPLMTMDTLPEDKKKVVWAWVIGRILMILYEHDLDVIKHAHGVKTDEEVADIMLKYGERTLKRYSNISDTTGRVLSGGITNRWNTRLKTVDTFLMTTDCASIPLSSIILNKSKCSEGTLLRSIRRLCDESFRFTTSTPIMSP